MRLGLVRLSAVLVVLMVSSSVWAQAAAPPTDKRFLKFKQRMMPHVGTRMNVRGRLTSGKLGYWIGFREWGAYIYAVNDGDLGRLNRLSKMLNHEVQITGILRYSPALPSPSDKVASPPEHFYFDISATTVTIVSSSRNTP